MSPLFRALIDAFEKRGWHHQVVEGQEVVETQFEAHHGKLGVHVQVFDSAGMASVVSVSPLRCPATHRSRVAELLMRTNQELTVGNFEMRWDEGEVLFRFTNLFEEGHYPDALLASMVHVAIGEMDRLIPFLGEVVKRPTGELVRLDIATLMLREDLLPPAPEDDEDLQAVPPLRDE